MGTPSDKVLITSSVTTLGFRDWKGKLAEFVDNIDWARGGTATFCSFNMESEIDALEMAGMGKIYDPGYKNLPVLKENYFRALREINPDGFDVFEK